MPLVSFGGIPKQDMFTGKWESPGAGPHIIVMAETVFCPKKGRQPLALMVLSWKETTILARTQRKDE